MVSNKGLGESDSLQIDIRERIMLFAVKMQVGIRTVSQAEWGRAGGWSHRRALQASLPRVKMDR